MPEYNTGAGERHYYIASKLAELEYDFTIVSGSVNHLFIKNPETSGLFSEESFHGGRFIWVKLRNYKPESLYGRLFSWFEFLFKLFSLPVRKYKPDLVLVSSMSLWSSWYGIYIKRRLRIPFVLEIRDIWPMTPVQVGGISKFNPFIIIFGFLEKLAYYQADAFISLMPGFYKHLTKTIKRTKCVHWIPNAIERNLLCEVAQKTNRHCNGKFTIVYAGALGYANAMECFIKAAILLASYEIDFLIIGDGPERAKLEVMAFDYPKIKFVNKVKKTEVLKVLLNADAGFISWGNYELYNYGVSANKYNDYMLAKLPIISSSNIPDDPVVLAGCGIQVPSGDANKIAEAILNLASLSVNEREKLGENGYSYVMSNNTYEKISKQYE
ncbi:MAG TPA: hypothetical protein DDW27_10970, partial [Bacteroidales bacterium]|nr:hypothetical protein [Bacteroidales bacterium]